MQHKHNKTWEDDTDDKARDAAELRIIYENNGSVNLGGA